MIAREVTCSTALQRTELPGLDYSLNPYRGCNFGCRYCFAAALGPRPAPWGEYVDAKVNLPLVLAQEIRRREKGVVGIATATDPYLPLEAKYGLTRRSLEVLLRYDWPVSIHTKSPAVMRDLDLLHRFSDAEVGFSICLWSEDMRRIFEPSAPPAPRRLEALRWIHAGGLRTWAFVGPILPGVTEFEAREFVPFLADAGVDFVMVDRLRLKPGIWPMMAAAMATHPALLERHRHALWGSADYFGEAQGRIEELCREHGLRVEEAFPRSPTRRPAGSSSANRSPATAATTLDLLNM